MIDRRNRRRACALLCVLWSGLCFWPALGQSGQHMQSGARESVYRSDLVTFPGPWAFQIGKSAIVLVSDKELDELADPDRKLNLALGFQNDERSLRQICEQAKAAGQTTL